MLPILVEGYQSWLSRIAAGISLAGAIIQSVYGRVGASIVALLTSTPFCFRTENVRSLPMQCTTNQNGPGRATFSPRNCSQYPPFSIAMSRVLAFHLYHSLES